jgi:hypothetical protein
MPFTFSTLGRQRSRENGVPNNYLCIGSDPGGTNINGPHCRDLISEMPPVNGASLACAIAISLVPSAAFGANSDWATYRITKTGAAVEIPAAIFSEDTESSEDGLSRHFYTGDRRADLTVQSIPNRANDSPATFLAKKRPPSGIVYKRVTPKFFVVSSFRNGKIWYNRCNRANQYMNCVLINYPAAEKRQWDAIVTRISHTLFP